MHPSEAKGSRLSRSKERAPSCPDRADRENTKLLQVAGVGPRRFYGDSAEAGGSLSAASPQMRPPPSLRKSGEGDKNPQLHCGKAQAASRGLQLVPAIRPLDSDNDGKDPLYIGLPNYGNSCYQNATLQSLLGLRPFLSEMISLISGLDESGQCRTLRAVAKLMVLRQKALSKSVSSHLNDLRDVFADIDPAFRGTEMQDANEFLLRLLDTMKGEIDARRPTDNPVRDNFQYQVVESYMCTKCHETALKRQENICWFVRVPRRQGTETPTLQDALRMCMRPDRRERLCQHCQHDECRVTTKISQLPRTLILQLNRAPARPSSPATGAEPLPPPPPAQDELVVLDADSESKPARTREDEDGELQEAISLCSVDLAGDFTYRLVGIVSHYGGATHSGHYVSDVYSVGRDRWYHYNDSRVSCVDEADIMGEGHQRNGYIFFYLHKDLYNQVVSAEGAGGAL
ncbi:ubiquitin carboxyl-terminal hydrolase 37-like [Amphibalanus amphitrite]|uniref:ubiquitin carboxyl-terminal hydrolase 37-like n=1 Tax=Amphibalanus amphitrite TaxID=1232801 RepID=UPI001C919A50|nr:ubiquitin carboxyl-terminal hydrolase 37-like [Amphibalanus amphitrite]